MSRATANMVETLALEELADATGVPTILFPDDAWGAEETVAAAWMRRMVGVYSGTILVDEVVDGCLDRADFTRLASILRHNPVRDPVRLARIADAWSQAITQLEARRDDAVRTAQKLLEDNGLDQDEAGLAYDYQERIQGIDCADLSRGLQTRRAQGLIGAGKAIAAAEKDLGDIRALVQGRREDTRRRALDRAGALFRACLERVGSKDDDERRIAELCLRALPSVVLEGDFDRMDRIEKSLEGHDTEGIEGYLATFVTAAPAARAPRRALSRRPNAGAPIDERRLSHYAREEMAAVPDIDLTGCSSVSEIERRTRTLADQQREVSEMGAVRIAGAIRLPAEARAARSTLLAEGLLLLARDELENRHRFNRAAAFSQDALRCLADARVAGSASPHREQQAVAGLIAANWLPKLGGARRGAAPLSTQGLLDAPAAVLEQLRAAGTLEIVELTWDLLDDEQARRVFWSTLTEADPDPVWCALLVRAALRPAYVTRNPENAGRQLALLLDHDEEQTRELVVALSPLSYGPRSTARAIRTAEAALRKLRDRCAGAPEIVLLALGEGIEALVAAMEQGSRSDATISVNAYPTSTTLYPAETDDEIDFYVAVHVQPGSAPIQSLTLECLFEGLGDTIRSQNPVRLEAGSVEEGVYEFRIPLRLDVRCVAMTNFFETTIRLWNADRPVDTTDRRQRFRIGLAAERPGDGPSPFVTGNPLLEKSRVFVGRDADMRQVLKTLIGNQQDNLPLVIGIRRIGKTSLLKNLMAHGEIQKSYVSVFVDLEHLPEAHTTADFLSELAGRIADAVSDAKVGSLVVDEGAFRSNPVRAFEKFAGRIDALPGKKRVLLLFDEFEALLANIDYWRRLARDSVQPLKPTEALVEVMPVLRSVLHHVERLSMVISGTPAVLAAFSGEDQRLFGNMLRVTLGPLKDDDVDVLLKGCSTRFQVTGEARSELIRATGLQPYLLQLALNGLFSRMLESGRSVACRSDVQRVVQLEILPEASYHTHFLDLARQHDGDLTLLRALAIAHERQPSSVLFAPVELVLSLLTEFAMPMEMEEAEQRLRRLGAPEIGLVQRAPNHLHRWRLVIGLLGDHLRSLR